MPRGFISPTSRALAAGILDVDLNLDSQDDANTQSRFDFSSYDARSATVNSVIDDDTQPVNISALPNGCDVIGVIAGTPVGTDGKIILSYAANVWKLQFQAPGDTAGAKVDVTGSAQMYQLASNSGYVCLVWADWQRMPTINTEDVITILADSLIPQESKSSDAALGYSEREVGIAAPTNRVRLENPSVSYNTTPYKRAMIIFPTSTSYIPTGSKVTWDILFQPRSDKNGFIWTKGSDPQNQATDPFVMQQLSGGYIYAGIRLTGGQLLEVLSPAAALPIDGGIHHLRVTYDGTVDRIIKLYIDEMDSEVASQTVSGSGGSVLNTTDYNMMFGNNAVFSDNLYGDIDVIDAMISSKIRSGQII